EAVAADPSYFEAHYNLGVAAYDARNWQIALQACENALAIRPNDFGARLNFALTLEKAGYPVDAAKELETLLTIHPNKPEVHLAAANLYAQVLDDTSMARTHYSRVLELDPRHPQAPAIRRWLLANRNR
ncbi:MAG: tetratricopeptide repeat protein, partial [Verrucomicrobiia bacterium]